MPSTTPTVSVLMANFNHARFIGEALNAILDQTHPPNEIIVADDASTDDSVKVISAFAEQHPTVRLIRSDRNRGVVATANVLLDAASSDYVAFAAADDKVLPGFLEKALAMARQYPAAGLISGVSRLMAEDGTDLGEFNRPMWARHACWLPPSDVARRLIRYGSWFMGNTTLFKRDSLKSAGGFNAELGAFCDGFASMVVALKDGACFVPEPFASWRRMETGYAATDTAKEERHLAITSRAIGLMRNEHADLFPPTLVDRWTRRWRTSWRIQTEVRKALAERAQRGSLTARPPRRDLALRVRIALIKISSVIRFRPPVLFVGIESLQRYIRSRQAQ